MVVLGEDDKEDGNGNRSGGRNVKTLGQFWPGVDAGNATRRGDRWGAGVFGWFSRAERRTAGGTPDEGEGA